MAYQGKTDWTKDDIVRPDDMNRIEQGIEAAHDSIENISQSLTPESIGAAKQSDFKTHIESTTAHAASSITVNDPEFADKNVLGVLKYLKSLANSIKTKVAAAIGSPATGEDTGDQLAKKINDAKAVGASNLVAKGVPATATESLATLFGKISNIIRGSGNAQPPEVLTGKTFTNNGGVPLTGTMPFRSAENVHMPSTEQTVWPGDRVFVKPPYGYYDGASWVTAPAPYLKPENIRAGTNILGVVGALVAGRPLANGRTGEVSTVVVSGLIFRPAIVICRNEQGDIALYAAPGILSDFEVNYEARPVESSQYNIFTITADGFRCTNRREDRETYWAAIG